MSVAATQHTFLFTDLVGFTALTAAHGDDRAAEVCATFYDCVRPLLAEHHAEEVKSIGDALMLRCDDTAAAIRLGIHIVDTLAELDGFPPVRVGIHTGSAVSRGGDWYGSAVNVASRLCSAAGGGEVLVSEATVQAAGRIRGIDLGDRRLHWLKNVTEPVGAQLASRHECTWSGRLRALRETRRTRLAT
jgi:adenylate cyclase